MPVFNDQSNRVPIVDDGDYIFCLVGFEAKLSSGGKTSGSEMFEIELELEPSGAKCYENLIDHDSCAWKLDTFLKSAGIKLTKGQSWDFRKSVAEESQCLWVDPMGLRGWCRVSVEEYTTQKGEKRKKNRVVTFYDDKPKLPARVIERRDDEAEQTEKCPF